MSRVQRMRRQAIVSLDSISNTISRQRRRRCRQYAPLALCLLLSVFAAVTFCRRLPAATAAAFTFAAAATLHSDCSNLTENVACATATFSLLRASVVPAMLTSSLTPTPTLTEKLTASAAVRVRVFTMDRAYRHLPEWVCVCCCRCFDSCCRWHCRCSRWRRGMQNSNLFFFLWCFCYFCAVPFALGLIVKEHRVYWACVTPG